MSSDNKVIVLGNDDHVRCAPTSSHDTIYANPTASIDPTCMTNHARVLPSQNAPVSAQVVSYQQAAPPPPCNIQTLGSPGCSVACYFHPDWCPTPNQGVSGNALPAVTGNGSIDNPFVRPCISVEGVECFVSFESRDLAGFWDNEYVPAYKCPANFPYLVNRKYGDMNVPLGVDVRTDNTDLFITGTSTTKIGDREYYTGTKTGFSNSSATNWDWHNGVSSYTIRLNCTSDITNAAFPTGSSLK
jgi:hypothetical protein